MKNIMVTTAMLLVGFGSIAFATQTTKPLAERLGGYKAITAVVDEFVGYCATDTRINNFFAATASDKKRLTKFKKNLTDQICAAGGGFYDAKHKKPCKYTGKDMKTAHKDMGVHDEHFTALVENLVKALEKFKVGETEKNELLSVLGPMKKDIVEPTGTTTH